MSNHRSLRAWAEARELSLQALHVTRVFWRPHASGLFGQLQRSALSVQLNIAEGYAAGGRARFVNHLRIAYGSAVETEELFDVAAADGLLPKAQAEEYLERCRRCQRLLAGLIKRYRQTS